jgi:hypothetical protein
MCVLEFNFASMYHWYVMNRFCKKVLSMWRQFVITHDVTSSKEDNSFFALVGIGSTPPPPSPVS